MDILFKTNMQKCVNELQVEKFAYQYFMYMYWYCSYDHIYNPYILEFKQTRNVSNNNAVNPFRIQG